ncbi:hypothetical protein [Paenibacillus lautus]|uniref:hypothetical protein n=1 Tax=Paenibacillus lautus TaxID=1401 RepID=UPI002DBBBB37|nr:hypothetical protein [Paenibacillus lautus]MEC0259329.1 hypothetical protein [Paenibacillus lautus]
MKRWITLLMAGVLTLVVSACGGGDSPEKINGMGPADIPLKYVNARVQGDDKTLGDLIASDTSHLGLKPKNPPQHPEYEVKTYELTQWKFDDNTYYYLMEFMNPARDNILDRQDFKIIKTKEGWKKEQYGETTDFDAIVSKLTESKKVLRELNEK